MFRLPSPVYAPADEGQTMFATQDSEATEATETTQTAETTADARPDWLLDKFKSPEDQAKAYNDLYGAYSKKTDVIRDELRAEIQAEYGKSVGVPDEIGGYEYPEGFEAPAPEVDETLRKWAKDHNVGNDAFKSLIADVYAKTQTTFDAEFAKLGDNAQSRIDKVNKWINANIEAKQFDQVSRVMQSAQGVEFFEYLMNKNASRNFAPDDPATNVSQPPLTRDAIREMQADPRFGEDAAYTQKVRGMWSAFAAQSAR